MTRTYKPLTKRRADELLDQARRDHRARMADKQGMVPTWRETAEVALMALALLIAMALLITVGSD